MIAEFDWWLLFVGLVLGAGLTWLVVSESGRQDSDLDERERASETAWIAARLKRSYPRLTPAQVDSILAEHRDYLAGPPPDPVAPPEVPASAADNVSERAEEDGVVG